MKKALYISFVALVVSIGCTLGSLIPTTMRIKKDEARIAELEEKKPDRSYTFHVEGYVIAVLTSEPQEVTHDMRLAYCTRYKNDAYIEVPVNDKSTELELVYTGYLITYTLDSGLIKNKVSNNGWALA